MTYVPTKPKKPVASQYNGVKLFYEMRKYDFLLDEYKHYEKALENVFDALDVVYARFVYFVNVKYYNPQTNIVEMKGHERNEGFKRFQSFEEINKSVDGLSYVYNEIAAECFNESREFTH